MSYAFFCATFASIGGLTFGYDQGVIANVLVMPDFVKRWPITPLEMGAMTAILELGAVLGTVLSGTFADRISRRSSIFLASVIFIIGSLFQCLAQSLTHIFIGRGIGGIGVGALSMLSPLYMAEIAPLHIRGSLLALEQFSIVVGVVGGFWIGFWTRNIPSSFSWRIPLGIQVIPGLVLALGCLILPASPRLLALQGRYDESYTVLCRLRSSTSGDDELVTAEFAEMKHEASLIRNTFGSSSSLRSDIGNWRLLFSKRYRKMTFIGMMIMVFQQWSGINALLYYGPTLVKAIGIGRHGREGDISDPTNLLIAGGIGIVQFLAVIPAIWCIDRVGRKPLLRAGSAMMFLSHILIALLLTQFSTSWNEHSVAAWIAVVCMYTFTLSYGLSLGPIGWVLPSEIFPLEVRSKGVGISTATNWICNFLVGLLTPSLVSASPSATFTIFATSCLLSYFWATYAVPETNGVSLERMGELFGYSTVAPVDIGEVQEREGLLAENDSNESHSRRRHAVTGSD